MTPEGAVMRAVLDWLAAKHIFAIRLNSGTQIGTHQGKKWAIHMAAPGTADIVAFPQYQGNCGCGTLHRQITPTFIECKAPKGKQSELQKSFQAQVEAIGCKYILAFSLDDLEGL